MLREQTPTKPEPAVTEDDEDINNEEEEVWDNDEDGDGEDDEDEEDDDEDTTDEQDTSEQTSNVAMTTTTTTTTESIEEVVRGEICVCLSVSMCTFQRYISVFKCEKTPLQGMFERMHRIGKTGAKCCI